MRKIIVFLLTLWCLPLPAHKYRLWYDKPAMTWTQALPVGNGIIGGMVFGIPAAEHIHHNIPFLIQGKLSKLLHVIPLSDPSSGHMHRLSPANCRFAAGPLLFAKTTCEYTQAVS